MDFLRNHAHLAGGDTRQAPKNTQFRKSRDTPRGQGSPPRQPLPIHQITAYHAKPIRHKGPPHTNPSQSTKSRQTLSILSNQNTLWASDGMLHLSSFRYLLCQSAIRALRRSNRILLRLGHRPWFDSTHFSQRTR
jgi:hypothetical protein